MDKIVRLVDEFCQERGLSVTLSHDMPTGYESAYGTYDVTINTLFLNVQILRDAPEYEVLFYLFHELRHALQYLRPDLFDEQIQESRFYVVLYNGICYKLVGTAWRKVVLKGSEEYFTRAYMSLPYELDANAFAYEKVKEICGETPQLHELYSLWAPKEKMEYEELRKIFVRIDTKIMRRF